MTHSGVNHRAPLRIGRHHRRRRPEISTAVDAGVSHVLSVLLLTGPLDLQLFWQSPPVCAALYVNVAYSVAVGVVVVVADDIQISTREKREQLLVWRRILKGGVTNRSITPVE